MLLKKPGIYNLIMLMLAVTAEIGLVAVSDNKELMNEPVRLLDGKFTILGRGPIFQGHLKTGHLLVSPVLMARNGIRSGVMATNTGLVIVTQPPAEFAISGELLTYERSPIFTAEKCADRWVLRPFTSLDMHDTGRPRVALKVAKIVYPRN